MILVKGFKLQKGRKLELTLWWRVKIGGTGVLSWSLIHADMEI